MPKLAPLPYGSDPRAAAIIMLRDIMPLPPSRLEGQRRLLGKIEEPKH